MIVVSGFIWGKRVEQWKKNSHHEVRTEPLQQMGFSELFLLLVSFDQFYWLIYP